VLRCETHARSSAAEGCQGVWKTPVLVTYRNLYIVAPAAGPRRIFALGCPGRDMQSLFLVALVCCARAVAGQSMQETGTPCMVHDRRQMGSYAILDTCVNEDAWAQENISSWAIGGSGDPFAEAMAYCMRNGTGSVRDDISGTPCDDTSGTMYQDGFTRTLFCVVTEFGKKGECGAYVNSTALLAALPAMTADPEPPPEREVSHVYVVRHTMTAQEAVEFTASLPKYEFMTAFYRKTPLKAMDVAKLGMTLEAGDGGTMRITVTLNTSDVLSADFPEAFSFNDIAAVSDVLQTSAPAEDDDDDDDVIIGLLVAAGVLLFFACVYFVYHYVKGRGA